MNQLAKDYYDYISYRMGILGLKNSLELSLNFYEMALKKDNRFIFGIYNNGKKIVRDEYFPRLFEKWVLRNKY